MLPPGPDLNAAQVRPGSQVPVTEGDTRRAPRPGFWRHRSYDTVTAAFVRPIDIVSTPDIAPEVYGNTFDRFPYHPS